MMLVTRKIALARILTGTMSTVLYEVEPTDPFVFMLVSAIRVVASLLACLIPSLRATKVDAMVTLRYE